MIIINFFKLRIHYMPKVSSNFKKEIFIKFKFKKEIYIKFKFKN